jgi:hypothetical protein
VIAELFFTYYVPNPALTYNCGTDACSRNRRFPAEMMHAGSIYEDQIETF